MTASHSVKTSYLEEILSDRHFGDTEITRQECKFKQEEEEYYIRKSVIFQNAHVAKQTTVILKTSFCMCQILIILSRNDSIR